MKEMERITFKAFRATDEPGLCEQFLREHRRVLEDFGITNVTTNRAAWTQDPDTYVIVAVSDRSGMVGGIRLEVDRGKRQLPIEEALMKFDPAVHHTLEDLRGPGNAEVCGLWNANGYNGHGLPTLLALAAVSIANQLSLGTVVCLVAHYTIRHAVKAGFTVMEHLGNQGTFTYPIAAIKAIAMVVPDVITLDTANGVYRNRLISLRLRPDQECVEELQAGPIQLVYRLRLKNMPVEMWAYRAIMEDRSHFGATG